MLNTMQQVFDEAAAIDRDSPDTARLLATHFEFTLSDIRADGLLNAKFLPIKGADGALRDPAGPVPETIFEYVPPRRLAPGGVPGRPNLTEYFQILGVKGRNMPVQLNGTLRIVRSVWLEADEIEPQNFVRPGEVYFTFEFADLWGLRVAVVPILLASDMRPFPGEIERQTANAGVRMKLASVKPAPFV